jgi:hypothetical protein
MYFKLAFTAVKAINMSTKRRCTYSEEVFAFIFLKMPNTAIRNKLAILRKTADQKIPLYGSRSQTSQMAVHCQ